MKEHKVGVIMNGVTGRMGTNQHLMRSILAIRNQGGVRVSAGEVIVPDPVLVGRNEDKLKALADSHGLTRFSTDLDACLADPYNKIYFDSQTTNMRSEGVMKAIAAKKAIYCEKPTAITTEAAYSLYKAAKKAGVKNGVVQDKLWLPGLVKLKYLIDTGFFGKIFSVRGEFGYWVFDGNLQSCQRPSWNYRKEDGGGIIMDMFCHWRYVIDNLFGNVNGVSCIAQTHIDERLDETGKKYVCTADDAAYATFTTDSGIVCQFNSSWAVRVRRDDLFTMQVDGSNGSAVAGLRKCVFQHDCATPRHIWNPDLDELADHYDAWQEVPNNHFYDNAFKVQWEMFLRHVVKDEPFRWSLLEGAKGVQLAEKGLESWSKKAWVSLDKLS